MNKPTSKFGLRVFLLNHWRVALIAGVVLASASGVSYLGQRILAVDETDTEIQAALERSLTTGIQYQLLFERMSAQLVKRSAGKEIDQTKLTDLNKLMQEKYKLLAQPVEIAAVARVVPDYRDDLVKLSVFMEEVGDELTQSDFDEPSAANVVQKFDKRHEFVDAMVYKVHLANNRQGEARLAALEKSRRYALLGAQALGWTFVLASFLYWLWARRLKLRMREQDSLIEASQKAASVAQDAAMAKNNFLAMISHELGTPVQTLINSIQFLTMRYRDLLDSGTIDRMNYAANQIEGQMRDLRDYARLDSGRLQLKWRIFSPGEALKKLISNYQTAAKQKGLTIVPNLGNTRVKVVLDEVRFQQIATNLITNAVKYSDKGTITVALRYVKAGDTDTLRLTVEDCGPGISKEFHEAVFDPFTQIDQSSTRRYEGVGMGLAIVKRLLELFGGSITLFSEPGHGARFEVRIPVEFATEHDSSPASLATRNVRGKDILLVDDHVEVLESLKSVLEQIGYRCETAQDGPTALQKTADRKYDAILLDINMPGMDGFTVATKLRETNGPNQEVPLIAISASAEQYSNSEQADLFTTFLPKPVRIETLDPILLELTC